MKQSSALLLLAYAAGALAAVEPYGQCGGDKWEGDTTCTSGFTCTFSSQWYSQCVPGSGGGVTTSKTTKSAKTTKTSSGATTVKTVTTSKTTKSVVTTTTGGGGGGPAPTGFPASAGTTAIPTFKLVEGVFDGEMLRWERNPDVCLDQTEGGEAGAMFVLEAGATLKNAIIGGSQAEGVHCRGPCTIENVWHLNVCEDATTFKQTSGTSYVIGGGAQGATDKILQFNGRGTVEIDGFYARNYGKVIRNCGDCTGNGGPRHIVLKNINAAGGGTLCGINTNYGDTCRISSSCQAEGKSCELYTGVTKGNGSSKKLSSGPDGKSCWVESPSC